LNVATVAWEGSCNPSPNTLSTGDSNNTFESPQFDFVNVGPDIVNEEHLCSYCLDEYLLLSPDPKNPSRPFQVCGHRFCREYIEGMEGLKNCLVDNCQGTTCKNLLKMDTELINRSNTKRCKELDSVAEVNNGVITDDVAGSRSLDQSLTSG
jgi:hypothetical protein